MTTSDNGRIKLTWGQIVVIIAWLASALLAYGAVDGRVRILEDRYERLFQDVSEIKGDVKMLLRQQGQ